MDLVSAEDSSARVPLSTDGPVTIGRSTEALRITDPSVSRQSVRCTWAHNSVLVEALKQPLFVLKQGAQEPAILIPGFSAQLQPGDTLFLSYIPAEHRVGCGLRLVKSGANPASPQPQVAAFSATVGSPHQHAVPSGSGGDPHDASHAAQPDRPRQKPADEVHEHVLCSTMQAPTGAGAAASGSGQAGGSTSTGAAHNVQQKAGLHGPSQGAGAGHSMQHGPEADHVHNSTGGSAHPSGQEGLRGTDAAEALGVHQALLPHGAAPPEPAPALSPAPEIGAAPAATPGPGPHGPTVGSSPPMQRPCSLGLHLLHPNTDVHVHAHAHATHARAARAQAPHPRGHAAAGAYNRRGATAAGGAHNGTGASPQAAAAQQAMSSPHGRMPLSRAQDTPTSPSASGSPAATVVPPKAMSTPVASPAAAEPEAARLSPDSTPAARGNPEQDAGAAIRVLPTTSMSTPTATATIAPGPRRMLPASLMQPFQPLNSATPPSRAKRARSPTDQQPGSRSARRQLPASFLKSAASSPATGTPQRGTAAIAQGQGSGGAREQGKKEKAQASTPSATSHGRSPWLAPSAAGPQHSAPAAPTALKHSQPGPVAAQRLPQATAPPPHGLRLIRGSSQDRDLDMEDSCRQLQLQPQLLAHTQALPHAQQQAVTTLGQPPNRMAIELPDTQDGDLSKGQEHAGQAREEHPGMQEHHIAAGAQMHPEGATGQPNAVVPSQEHGKGGAEGTGQGLHNPSGRVREGWVLPSSGDVCNGPEEWGMHNRWIEPWDDEAARDTLRRLRARWMRRDMKGVGGGRAIHGQDATSVWAPTAQVPGPPGSSSHTCDDETGQAHGLGQGGEAGEARESTGGVCDHVCCSRRPFCLIAALEDVKASYIGKAGLMDFKRKPVQNAILALERCPRPVHNREDAAALGITRKTLDKVDEILRTGGLERTQALAGDEQRRVEGSFLNVWGVGESTARAWYAAGCRTVADVRARGGVSPASTCLLRPPAGAGSLTGGAGAGVGAGPAGTAGVPRVANEQGPCVIDLTGSPSDSPQPQRMGLEQRRHVVQELALPPLPHALTEQQRVGLKYHEDLQLRIPRSEVAAAQVVVMQVVVEVLADLTGVPMSCLRDMGRPQWLHVRAMGSFVRGAPTSGDIDFIVSAPAFVSDIEAVAAAGGHSTLQSPAALMSGVLSRLAAMGALSPDYCTPEEWSASHAKHGPNDSASFSGIWSAGVKAATAVTAAGAPAATGVHAADSGSTSVKVLNGHFRRIDIKVYPRSQLAYAVMYFSSGSDFNKAIRLWCNAPRPEVAALVAARVPGAHAFKLSDRELVPTRKTDGPHGKLVDEACGPDEGCTCETEIFAAVGLSYVPPHMRVDL